MRTAEIISTLICIASGIVTFVIFKICPGSAPASPPSKIDILKTVFSIVFLFSGLLAFVLQIYGLLQHK
jgi:hypothetical protein